MSNLPIPFQNESHRPLGSAAWHAFPAKDIPRFRSGDFWLSHLPTGEAIGIRDDRHVLIVGGTRGGKGVSYIVPNLCAWKGSVVVIDPKGENAMITARRRGGGSPYCDGMGQQVYILDPFRAASTAYDDFTDLSAGYNPLDGIRLDDDEAIDVAARIAEAFIVGGTARESVFDDTARWALKIFLLHVRSSDDYLDDERNLNTVRTLLMVGNEDIKSLLVMNGHADPLSGLEHLFLRMKNNFAFGGVVSSAGVRLLRLIKETPKFFESFIQVAVTNTDFLDSPQMKRCVARSSFALHELKTDPQGVSVYLTLPQRYMPTHFRWLRMMTSLIAGEMECVKQKPATGHQILMVLDEFASLKRMQSIENAAAQIAGFGVKLVMVVQNLPQLKELYRDNWETLVSNAGTKLFFCNEDNFTREYASKLIGDCEVVRVSGSKSTTTGHSTGWSVSTSVGTSASFTSNQSSPSMTYGYSSGSSSTQSGGSAYSQTSGSSESVHKRPLVTPDEIGRIFGSLENPAALLLIAGYQPIALRRSPYYSEFMWAGYYDRHKDHPAPLSLDKVEQKRIALKQEAEARKAALQAKVEAARRKAALEDQKRVERKARIARIRLLSTWSAGLVLISIVGLGFASSAGFFETRSGEPVRSAVPVSSLPAAISKPALASPLPKALVHPPVDRIKTKGSPFKTFFD